MAGCSTTERWRNRYDAFIGKYQAGAVGNPQQQNALLLTMLGIIIGIGSVIAIVSIGDTMRSVIASEYENVGINRVIVHTMAADNVYYDSDMFTQDDVDAVKEAFWRSAALCGHLLPEFDDLVGRQAQAGKGQRLCH